MSKIINVSSENIRTIELMNKENLFKVIKVYKYKDCSFFYCITHYNALHISGSSKKGPANEKDLVYVFKKLTNKSINNFKLMKTNRVLYLIEEDNLLN